MLRILIRISKCTGCLSLAWELAWHRRPPQREPSGEAHGNATMFDGNGSPKYSMYGVPNTRRLSSKPFVKEHHVYLTCYKPSITILNLEVGVGSKSDHILVYRYMLVCHGASGKPNNGTKMLTIMLTRELLY